MSVAQVQIGAQVRRGREVSPAIERVGAMGWAEVTLISGIVVAVLAFGGTEAASFSLVEILYGALGIVLLVRWREGVPLREAGIVVVPGMLVGMALLQLCPVPAEWLRGIGGANADVVGARFSTLTIDPYATRVQLLILVTCVIGFVVTNVVSRDPGARRRFIRAFIGLGMFEALYGLTQYLTGWQKIFGYEKKFDLEEATGTYINRNHYAGFLEMVLPFALALALYALAKQQKTRSSAGALGAYAGGAEFYKVVGRLAIAVLMFAALIFSRSRMGILAAAVSTLLMLGLFASGRSHRRAGLAICGVFLAVTAAVAVWIGAGSVVERFEGVREETAGGDHSRISIWRDTVRLIGRHPWMGTGLGTFPIAFTAVQTTFLNEFVNHAHNDYLELASDVGVPVAAMVVAGFLLLLARAVRAFYSAERRFDRFVALGCTGSIAAILLHSLADFNLYIPANSLLLATISGLTLRLEPKSAGSVR
jgi:O-antigen ligase